MSLTDLRQRTKTRSQSHGIGDDTIDPDLRGDVEKLFDRPNIVSEVESLLDDKELDGTEVLTIDQDLVPVSKVRHVARPALRKKIGSMIQEGGGNFEIGPDPEIEVTTAVGFPGVRVAPQGARSVTIQYVPGPEGKEGAGEDVLSDLQEATGGERNYVLLVNGVRYPILDVQQTVLELGREPEFGSARHGLIYNGADRFLIVTTRTASLKGNSVEDRKGKDQVQNLQERPVPLLKTKTLPGKHDVRLVSKNDQSRSEYGAEGVTFNVEKPPKPGVGEAFYTFGRPERDAPGKNRLNSSLTKLGIAGSISYPSKKSSIVIGARCRVGTKSANGWKYGQQTFNSVRPEAMKWQLNNKNEDDDTTLGVVFQLGQYKPGHRRRVEVKFVDEMGRVVKEETVEKEAVNPLESGLTVHRSLPERFSKFVDGAAVPLRTDVVSFYDDADAQIEDLKAKAETIIQNKTVEEVPVEQLKAPNPRLDLEVVGGRTISAKATRTAHPNSLSMEYRFAFGSSDQFGEYGGPVKNYAFDESGERSITLQVKGDAGQTSQITETIVLPNPVLSFDFYSVQTGSGETNGNKTVNVDTTESVLGQGTLADYRYAYKIWDSETQYSPGDTVYYEPNETIYVANTSDGSNTTLGLNPPDGDEWDEVPFGASSNKDYHEYSSDSSGEKTIVVQAKDDRGAFGETRESFYIPDVDVSFKVEDGIVTIREKSAPEEYDLLYRFDWGNGNGFSVGPTTLPIGKDYDEIRGNNVAIQAISPSNARDLTTIYIPNLSPALSVTSSGSSSRQFELDASGSALVGGDDSALEYRFDPQGDGEFDGQFSASASTEYVYEQTGLLSPRVQVREPNLGIRQTASQTALVYEISSEVNNKTYLSVQPSSVESGLEGEVFQYKYSFDGTYGDWSEDGRRTHDYAPISDSGESHTVSVKIRRPNRENSTEYTVSDTVYWPKAPSLSVSKDGLVVGLTYSADVLAGAPYSVSDLELQVDFGSGETTTAYRPIGQMPNAYTYSSEGAYSYTIRARAPNGAVNSATGSIDVGVDLDLPDFPGDNGDTGFI